MRRRRRMFLLLVLSILFTFFYIGMGNIESLPGFLPFAPMSSGRPRKPTKEDKIYQELQRPLLATEYGTTARPPFQDIKHLVQELPKEFVPVPAAERKKDGDEDHKPGFGGSGSKHKPARRLVIVGDVHGMKTELQSLLKLVNFDKAKGDHLILAGDMVSKGPDTPGVVQLAMDLGASAVRGNHEDRVLLAHAAAQNEAGRSGRAVKKPEQEYLARGVSKDRKTAASLSNAQRKWLANLPCILNVGPLLGSELRSVAVAHAGIVPRVALKKQDPFAVMNMRTLKFPSEELRKLAVRDRLEHIAKQRAGPGRKPQPVTNFAVEQEIRQMEQQRQELIKKGRPDPWSHDHDVGLPTSGREGEPWSNVWDSWMENEIADSERMTVVYGHDARRGFHMGKWTLGLDSGCVYGKKLSALVIEAGEREMKHEFFHVSCREAKKLEEDEE
jgi:bis(5'-nucleosyl)-tetraphosphatase (symmetrical)